MKTVAGASAPKMTGDANDALALQSFRLSGEAADLTEVGLRQKAEFLARAFRGRLPSPAELRDIVQELGVEIATAVFLRSILDSNVHGPFNRDLPGIEPTQGDLRRERVVVRGFEVAIIASNFFQSGRLWGDHVASWRSWARELGFSTEVIETDPRRSIAANARLIFDYLARSPARPRLIVSYGQGAAEFRYLLHRRVNRDPADMLPDEIKNIRGWINVCGAFAGSGLSRELQKQRLRRLLFRLRMKVAGRNPITLAETSSSFALWRKPMPVPPGLNIVSIVGLPYRWQLPKPLQTSYDQLALAYPNDGVLSVYEAAAYPGLIVPVAGMSHQAADSLLAPVFKRVLSAMLASLDTSSSAELQLA